MAHFQSQIEIAAPREQVFEMFSDLHHAAGRIRGITNLEVLTEGPIGAGTKFRETRKMFGKEHTETMSIREFEAPNRYTVECESCGAKFHTELRFQSVPAGTRVEMTFNTKPITWIAKLMAPLSALMIGSCKKEFDKDLFDLKAALEGTAPLAGNC